MKQIKTFLFSAFSKAWYGRNSIPLFKFPMLCRLPYGGWFLSYPDEMGLNLVPKLWKRSYSSYEEGEWRFVKRFIKPGMVGFDIGANQGFYSILLSKQVGAQGKVFVFEPVPGEFRKLRRNLQINSCYNLVLEKMGISCYEGVAEMIICLNGHGSRSSMASPPEEVNAMVKVEKVSVTTLDYYILKNSIKEIHFIKVDVEGSERDVIRGAEKYVLKELRPVVMIEMADVATQQFGYSSVDIYRDLERLGFKMFEITPIGLLRSACLKEFYRENMLAVPHEKIEIISAFMERNKK